MNTWFRLYDEVVDDPKVQLLPPALFRAWINFMCIASKNSDRRGTLPAIEDVAYRLHVTKSKAEWLLKELVQAQLFEWKDGAAHSHNWPQRQFQSDTSTQRVKRFRNGKGNVSETPYETDHSRADTESEQSIADTEEKPPVFAVTELDFQDIWRKHPNPKGRKEALRHFYASVKTQEDLGDIRRALENYRNQRLNENARRKERGESEIPWQNGSTWFNNWRDWIPEDFEQPDDPHTCHTCNFCGEESHVWPCDGGLDCTISDEAACPEFRAKHKERMAVKV